MYSVFKEFPKGWGVKKIPRKWKILGGGGVLCEIPSVVGVWIFSVPTQFKTWSADTAALSTNPHKIEQDVSKNQSIICFPSMMIA